MIPELSDETQAATAGLATILALGRTRHRGRPWDRRARSLLAIASARPPGGVCDVTAVPAPAPAPCPPTPRRVLCTDRDSAGAESLARSFRQAGFDARGCADGPTALVEVTDFRPHACVIDLETPGIGGYELAQWVRSEVGGLTLLVGAADRTGDDLDRVAAEAGFDLVLTRPADTDLVIGLLGGRARRDG